MIQNRLPKFKKSTWYVNERIFQNLLKQVELFKHPHLLLLQVRNSVFELPGGRLRPSESGTTLSSLLRTYLNWERVFRCFKAYN